MFFSIILVLIYFFYCVNIFIYFFNWSHPGYFGKVGMRQYRVLKNRLWRPALNLDRLWSLVTEQHREAYANKTEVAPVIDCVKAVSIWRHFNYLLQVNLFELISFKLKKIGLPQGIGQRSTTKTASDCQG